MKLTILAAINLIALSALAQSVEKPFALDAGKYSETCYSVSVEKIDDELVRQSSQTDNVRKRASPKEFIHKMDLMLA